MEYTEEPATKDIKQTTTIPVAKTSQVIEAILQWYAYKGEDTIAAKEAFVLEMLEQEQKRHIQHVVMEWEKEKATKAVEPIEL